MFQNFKFFFSILDRRERKKIFVLFSFVLFSVLLEMVGISLILPVISSLIEVQNEYLNFISNIFENFSQIEILYLTVFLLIFVYFLKNLYLTCISYYQNNYIVLSK